MNRVYRLVWNRSLAVMQVTSELTHTRGSSSATSIARAPRRRPLALAIATVALACASAPAWSQTCSAADPSACGAAGGAGGHPGRNNNGGTGDGAGGDATYYTVATGTSEVLGSPASNGAGGDGSTGVDINGSTLAAAGGTGGAAGATGSTNITNNVSTINGGNGAYGKAAPSGSFLGGGGGGGGAGGYVNDAFPSPIAVPGTTINGGTGGQGGDATGATNADPGAGGGGGAGVIIGANAVNFTNFGTLKGGAGGAGGSGGYAGSGGGGGDGVLVLGAGSSVNNELGGYIKGGAGGAPGTFTDGQGAAGGYGGGGAGVNLASTASLNNSGTIIGGAGGVSPVNSLQSGAPGVGVRGWGDTTVNNYGSIAGGIAGDTQADSVQFSGGGNLLVIEPGSSFTGAIVSGSGSDPATGDTLDLTDGYNATIDAGLISGFATNVKTGSNDWTLTGTGTAGINWTVQQGELSGNSATFAGNVMFQNTIGAPTVDFDQATDGTYAGSISGTGELIKDGAGTLTLSGSNSYSDGTLIDAGTLQGTTTSLQGNIVDNAALVFNQTVNGSYDGVISGIGTLTISGTAAVTLNGVNAANGLITVTSGATLLVGDSAHMTAAVGAVGGDVSVTGGTLGGYGTVLGSVTLSNGAALTPGSAGAVGSLTITGDLTIGDGSQLNFDFGAPGPNFSTPGQSDHVAVGGSLSIGSSTLNVNNLGSMGPGLYELFSWTDTLDITGGGFAPPSGMTLQTLTVDKELNLIDTLGVTLDEWDANGLASSSALGGGSGTWSTTSDVWSDTSGQYVGPMSPQPGFAIFGGAAGTVTVNDSNGAVSTTGMQFVSDGYQLTGDAIDLVAQNGVAPVLRVSSGDTAIINNELDGTDGFNKTDGGTLVLTGTNAYTGTTTLSGGYLSVSSDANLGASADPLDFNGGTLEITGTAFNQTARNIIWGSGGGGFEIDDASNTFTVTQALTGSGGLLMSGAGTLVLGGANTYSGGTVIDGGTLQGDTTSLQGSITNNARLVFAQTGDGTFSGAISGTGQLIKNGAGTLVLSGADTYTGGTMISAGTLQGDTTSLQGTITNNAALVFNQASNGTFSGVVGGSGSFTKTGAGTLILDGANTYTGGTTINAGTLQGDTTSLQGNITDNAALVFNQASDATFSSVISGSGSFTKTGAGTLILDGVNTYTGGTTVSAGTLEVGDSNTASASINGAVDVQGAGTLRGHGTIDGNVVSDGIVWPGGSMGTLAINGNYTQNADGTLQLDVTPTQSSMLQVSGNASLAGTLDLIFAPGTYGSGKFNLLQAGSVSGTFGTVNGTVPGQLTSSIDYGTTDVELVLAQRLVRPLDGSVFGNLLRGVNVAGQQDLNSVLDVSSPGGTPCNADHAASMQNVTASCGTGVWAQYTGSNIALNGANGLNSTAFGLLGGADYAIGDVVHAGVEAGVGQLNGNDTTGGNGRADNVHGGVYAYADTGPMVLSGVLDTMHSDYHFSRATGIGAAISAPDGNMQSAAVQAAWPLQLSQWQLTPKVGALYQRQTLDGFSEALSSTNPEASSFPVDGTRSRYISLQPYADMAIAHSFVADGVTYLPQLSLGYRYDTRTGATPVVQVTAQDGTVFDLPGAAQGRGMGTASARITAQAGASWSLYADYQGLFGSGLHDNALSVGFTKHF